MACLDNRFDAVLRRLLLVLCIVIVIVVSFFLFYFNRLVAWTFAFFIRVFFWKSSNVWLECGNWL